MNNSLPNLMQGAASLPLLNHHQHQMHQALMRSSQNSVNSSAGIQNLQGAQSASNGPYGTNYADSLTKNCPAGGAATPMNMRNLTQYNSFTENQT